MKSMVGGGGDGGDGCFATAKAYHNRITIIIIIIIAQTSMRPNYKHESNKHL